MLLRSGRQQGNAKQPARVRAIGLLPFQTLIQHDVPIGILLAQEYVVVCRISSILKEVIISCFDGSLIDNNEELEEVGFRA